MAKADDTTSTIEIWLRDALALAVKRLGSVALAKKRLTEWLAAGKLPWFCMDWKADKYYPGSVFAAQLASIASGDPRFWSDLPIKIDWEDNCAREDVVRDGARALGISVSHTHLLAQLPEGPDEREEARGAATSVRANKAAPTKRKAKAQTDRDRARWAILQLYPKARYPSGVPDTVKPGVLHHAVANFLAEQEPAELKLSVPSLRTVQRARHSL